MKALIINNHTKNIEELVSLFPNSTVVQKEVVKNLNTNDYDLVIISGGSNVPTILRHPEQYFDEIQLIRSCSIPMVGICLGAELLTYVYGGELQELPQEHTGPVDIKVKDFSLSNKIGSLEFVAQEGHRISIKTLPEDFISCAYSDHGIEIFKHTSKPILGLQFHPELQKDEKLMAWIFDTLKVI